MWPGTPRFFALAHLADNRYPGRRIVLDDHRLLGRLIASTADKPDDEGSFSADSSAHRGSGLSEHLRARRGGIGRNPATFSGAF